MTEARILYLFLYNSIQWTGWLAILADRVAGIETSSISLQGTVLLYIFQSMAVLEILHSFSGLVRANPTTTLVQVISRVQLILVHAVSEDAQVSSGLIPMILAWGMVEVIRYLYLALNMLDMAPGWLHWLRYSLFYVLYPLGVYGEMKVLYDALPYLESSRIFSVELPNEWNFSFSFSSYVWVLIYVIYLPGLYVQYTHMMRQRSKALSPVVETEAKKTQ
jgi:very-long-chain (3R)-3-hydroxyacyl-CoA dehydratase